VIGLRADHDVDEGRAADDLRAFGLRHAAGDGDHHAAPVFARLPFLAQAAQFGEGFLRCPLADMAGVEDHHVGILRRIAGLETQRRQHVGHARRIVHVHLAPIGADEKFLAGALVHDGAAIDRK
jgi:hypothetical protein